MHAHTHARTQTHTHTRADTSPHESGSSICILYLYPVSVSVYLHPLSVSGSCICSLYLYLHPYLSPELLRTVLRAERTGKKRRRFFLYDFPFNFIKILHFLSVAKGGALEACTGGLYSAQPHYPFEEPLSHIMLRKVHRKHPYHRFVLRRRKNQAMPSTANSRASCLVRRPKKKYK